MHIVSGQSNYQTRVLEVATTFANETDGTWLMADWDQDGIPDWCSSRPTTPPTATSRCTSRPEKERLTCSGEAPHILEVAVA